MAISYMLYKDNRADSANKGKFYARAIHFDTKTTKDLAISVEKNCTVTRADILAVIDALVFCMKRELQDSYSVKLNGLGTFSIGFQSKPVNKAEDFNPVKDIVRYRVNFKPEVTGAAIKGQPRSRYLVDGATATEAIIQDKVKPRKL